MKLNTLKVVQIIISVLERLAPFLAKKIAINLFYSPRTSKKQIPELPNMKLEWCEFIKTNGSLSKCRVYSSGTGPTVLLVHGWEGSAWSMSSIAKYLLESNLRVILFDLPAHGFSKDKRTNILEIRSIIQKLTAAEEDLLAIVSHSFGAVCAGYAIKSGVSPKYFVSIGAPTSMKYIIDSYCSIIGASASIKKVLIDNLEGILKVPYETESLTNVARHFNLEGLIIHDRNDRRVPYAQAKELLTTWTGSKLITTEKLGHNGTLNNNKVIDIIKNKLVPT